MTFTAAKPDPILPAGPPLLSVRNVVARYGLAQALSGSSVDIYPQECLALIGRNGVGKTTLAHVISGLLPVYSGSITFAGTDFTQRSAQHIVQAGIALVPQSRRIFGSLTVAENLRVVAGRPVSDTDDERYDLARIYDLFPRLGERSAQRAGTLSGGEQQMLAIGRALMCHPRLLILDEPTEGLAPLIVDEVVAVMSQLNADGVALLLLEQRIGVVRRLADAVCVMGTHGIIGQRRRADQLQSADIWQPDTRT